MKGAPELIVEIAGSSVSLDVHDKLKVYCQNQVQEYLVYRWSQVFKIWCC
ncbi:Uma2 family endonuclease [Dapis sp. BLCC M229]